MSPLAMHDGVRPRPMRVLLTHMYCWPEVRRGGERYLHEFGAALRDAGNEVRIVSSSRVPGRASVLGVDVRTYTRRYLPRRVYEEYGAEFLFGLESLARLGASGRFDVWHAFSTADAAAAALSSTVRRRQASAFTALGFPRRASRDQRPDRRLHDFVVRRVDHYLCLSESTARHLEAD